LMTVSTHLWLPSGAKERDPDCLIYVFRKEDNRWSLVLQTEADYDPRCEEEEKAFRYEISPPDREGRWFLLVAHVQPVLRQRTPLLKYKVLRPGLSPEKSVLVIERQEPFDPMGGPFALEVTSTGFKLARHVDRWLDGDLGTQNSAWRVVDNKAIRIGRLAETPEDFLDYWLQLPWEEAALWSETSRREDLKIWHAQMSKTAPGFSEIRIVQRCLPKGDSWQVGISFDRTNEETLRMKEVFVTVGWKANDFVLLAFDRKRPSGCPGETPPAPLPRNP